MNERLFLSSPLPSLLLPLSSRSSPSSLLYECITCLLLYIMGAQIIGRRSPPPLRSSPTVSVSSSSSTRCTVGIGPTRSALHTAGKHSKYSRTTKCAALLAGLLVIVWLESLSVMVSLHHNDLVDSNASVHHHLPIPMSSMKLRAAANHLRHTSTQKQQQKQQHTLSNGNKLPKHYIQLSPPTATNNHHTNHHSSTATASAAALHPWSYPIIHIVTTRFMQGQGTLVNLARSRLKLLQVICLPSIVSQTILNNNSNNHDTLLEVYSYTKWEQEVAKKLNKNMNARQQQQQRHYISKQQQHHGVIMDPAFIWIIKVDPNIDRHVLSELLTILEPVKQFTLVVGSNTNYGIGIKPGGWRDGQAGQDVLDAYENGHVYFPSSTTTTEEGEEEGSTAMMQMLRRAHEARNERVIIETRLDADDAVNVDYLAALQQTAVRTLIDPKLSGYDGSTDDDDNANEESNDAKTQQQQQQEVETARWLYLCPHTHVQWNPSSSIFDGGSSDTNDDNSTPGMLQVFQMPNTCVTAGLSTAFAVGTEEKDVPRYEHSKIFWEITIHHNNEGKQTRNNSTAGTTEHFGNNTTITAIDKHDCGLYPSSKCAVFVDDPKVSAFRSRAMTSAGMHNIEARGEPTVDTPQHYKEIAAKLWQHSIEKNFGISTQKAKEAAAFMSRNYLGTVRDNLRGQCTSGHSCKISSLEKLQRTIDLIEEERGGVEII